MEENFEDPNYWVNDVAYFNKEKLENLNDGVTFFMEECFLVNFENYSSRMGDCFLGKANLNEDEEGTITLECCLFEYHLYEVDEYLETHSLRVNDDFLLKIKANTLWDFDPKEIVNEKGVKYTNLLFEYHLSRVKHILFEEENTKYYPPNYIGKEIDNANVKIIDDFHVVMEMETLIRKKDGNHSLGVKKMNNMVYIVEATLCEDTSRRKTLAKELTVASKEKNTNL